MTGTFLANGTSAHYGVEPGHVRQFVNDDNGAWAAGDGWANNKLLHVECVNSAVGGDWPVADGTVDTLVEFLADKSREHGWGHLVVGENLYGHRDFYNTYCPGVLYARLGEITERVNAKINGEDDMPTLEEIWNYEITDPEGNTYPAYQHLSWARHYAKNGPDDTWDVELTDPDGNKYPAWQHLVWDRYYAMRQGAQIDALTEAVKTLAGMQGGDPEAVVKAVSDAVAAKLESIQVEVMSK